MPAILGPGSFSGLALCETVKRAVPGRGYCLGPGFGRLGRQMALPGACRR